MRNKEIANLLKTYASLLAIKGENFFKVRAYQEAGRVLENLPTPIEKLIKEGYDLTQFEGIGKDLAKTVEEIVTTSTFKKLEEIKKEYPLSLLELLEIEGLGAKRVNRLYKKLKISSKQQLCQEVKNLSTLEGFGKKLQQKILQYCQEGVGSKKFLWVEAKEYLQELQEYLLKINPKKLSVAGSFRRKKEVVGDIDLLASKDNFQEVIKHFIQYPKIKKVLGAGETKASVILEGGLKVDLRSVEEESFGAALQYFTGSKAHNVKIRKIAQEQGLKVNEYGVFKKDKKVAGKEEEEVYKILGLCWIEPELREDRGEIEACKENKLPKLITTKDLQGDLHLHTNWSDGRHSLLEMAKAGKELGYSYLAITDHSKRLTIANGLDEKRLLKQIEEIKRLNEELKGFTLLTGMEVDILEDGSLDLKDEVLKELDVVVISLHYKFNLSKKRQTLRVLKAFDNPYVNIFAHPTARRINLRPPVEIDLEKVFLEAKERNIALEINSQPDRLDLDDKSILLAKKIGAKMVINSDAHNIYALDYIEYGVNQARRGWCEKTDIINTLKLKDLKTFLRSRG